MVPPPGKFKALAPLFIAGTSFDFKNTQVGNNETSHLQYVLPLITSKSFKNVFHAESGIPLLTQENPFATFICEGKKYGIVALKPRFANGGNQPAYAFFEENIQGEYDTLFAAQIPLSQVDRKPDWSDFAPKAAQFIGQNIRLFEVAVKVPPKNSPTPLDQPIPPEKFTTSQILALPLRHMIQHDLIAETKLADLETYTKSQDFRKEWTDTNDPDGSQRIKKLLIGDTLTRLRAQNLSRIQISDLVNQLSNVASSKLSPAEFRMRYIRSWTVTPTDFAGAVAEFRIRSITTTLRNKSYRTYDEFTSDTQWVNDVRLKSISAWKQEKDMYENAVKMLVDALKLPVAKQAEVEQAFRALHVSTPIVHLVASHFQELSQVSGPSRIAISAADKRYKELHQSVKTRAKRIFPTGTEIQLKRLTSRMTKLLQIAETEKFGQQFTWETIKDTVDNNRDENMNLLRQQAQLLLLLA